MTDPYDQFWQWANKPRDSYATISWLIHGPVMELAAEDRKDRAKVNEAVAGFEPQDLQRMRE
jgi:hypothetical protein